MFDNKTHLNNHLTSAAHRRLTVVCQWCKGRDRTFTRIADLEVHYNSLHTEVHVPKKVFSRQNGFYLARYPEDYVKIVGKVTPYDSEEAHKARQAVRTWAEGFNDGKERLENWNNGWKEADRSVGRERSVSSDRRLVNRRQERESSGRSSDRVEGIGERRQRKDVIGRDTSLDGQCLEMDRVEEKHAEVGSSVNGTGDKCSGAIGLLDKGVRSESSGKRNRQDNERDQNKQLKPSELYEDGLASYQDDIYLGEEAGNISVGMGEKGDQVKDTLVSKSKTGRETRGVIDDESESGSSSSSSGSSSVCSRAACSKTIFQGLGGDLKERAHRILQKGCMPICPPAKRDWTITSEFDSDSGLKLEWPPVNWQKLSADQKLMAREYASIFVEKNTQKNFPEIPRRLLLDKYQFLSLEGEGKIPEEENPGDKIDARIRSYNFSYVKAVVNGEIKPSRVAWSIIKSIERADRWTDTDKITDVLDKHGIKIKL